MVIIHVIYVIYSVFHPSYGSWIDVMKINEFQVITMFSTK